MNYQKFILPIIGAVVGSACGFLYWYQIGCASGTCMITSKPVNSTIYGAVMGYLLFDILGDLLRKK